MNYQDIPVEKLTQIGTLGELRATGYTPRTVKEELRANLIARLQSGAPAFEGIYGYENTVIPDLQRAILARHNINLLGLRGQAKTRMARKMVGLLDDYIPVVAGSELNDDPLAPLSFAAREMVASQGDQTPISWVHREERYTEKLATPDVSVADLIGDVDPIKAASLKLSYNDERVIHYGLIPRSHRGIFVINELPDLQARIQVALFNILQEGDIQIRGFKLRLPLDIQFVFTANPEDYTNRGSIVTPLKDRIDSQIITHYPEDIKTGRKITQQEAKLMADQSDRVMVNEVVQNLVEQIAFEARDNEYVDAKSGVSARLTISAYENLISAAERRAIINGEEKTHVRVADFIGVHPAITGKVELVYEGEQEGPGIVAGNLVGKSIRTLFLEYFPNPEDFRKAKEAKEKKKKIENPYNPIVDWFGEGNVIDLLHDAPEEEYRKVLNAVPGLRNLIEQYHGKLAMEQKLFLMEFALHGLAEYSMLSKSGIAQGLQFKDLLSSMFTMPDLGGEDDENYG